MGFQIAIDGPAGAGKSTVAKMVAEKLSFIYVDTGAMYRAMALYMLRQGISAAEKDRIISECRKPDITIRYEDGVQVVLLDGENVNDYIRTPEVSEMSSECSAIPDVREALLALQNHLAENYDVVMDGRDIGTVILPNAEVKIFLTASVETRALRRYKEMVAKGQTVSLAEIEKDILERDYRDTHRETSPLKEAGDAHRVDSSYMTPEEVTLHILNLVEKAKKDGSNNC